MNNTEGYDSYVVYIWMMGILCALASIWLVYNRYVLVAYENDFASGIKDYNKIIALEQEIPLGLASTEENEKPPIIEEAITFFKRTVPGIVPNTVEGPEKEKGSLEDIAYEDYIYTINFTSISREQLARYIFYIQQKANSLNVSLKVSSMEILKREDVPSHEDSWKAELVFINRREAEEE